jgi:hypothetical protein
MKTKLLLYLNPVELPGMLPKGHMPVFPFFTGVSRLNYKPDAFEFKQIAEPISDILVLPNHRKSFAEVCNERAIEISKLPGTLYVMWSGGIDSTVAIAAILKNWSADDLKRVVVLCNNDSIKENKNFFSFIAKNFKVETSTDKIENLLKLGYVLTGEMGDQILGSDVPISTAKQGEEILFENFENGALKMYSAINQEYAHGYFNKYRPIIDEAPFKIKTVFDFCWWLNFTQKWQHIKFRTLASKSWTDPGKWESRLLHFFDTLDFQVWSIHNHDKKIKTSWHSYKYIAKEYVIEYTKDQLFMNKLKLPSLQNLFLGNEFNWSIDEEWNFLDKAQTLERIKEE